MSKIVVAKDGIHYLCPWVYSKIENHVPKNTRFKCGNCLRGVVTGYGCKVCKATVVFFKP